MNNFVSQEIQHVCNETSVIFAGYYFSQFFCPAHMSIVKADFFFLKKITSFLISCILFIVC
jgi:hypothetical protein